MHKVRLKSIFIDIYKDGLIVKYSCSSKSDGVDVSIKWFSKLGAQGYPGIFKIGPSDGDLSIRSKFQIEFLTHFPI